MGNNLNGLIELIGHKILIKEDSFDEITKSGLKFLKKDENKTIGTVLLNNYNTAIYNINDRVVYPTFAGVNVEIDNVVYKTLETREVFFTYNDEEISAKNNFVVVRPIMKNDNRKLKAVKEIEESNTNGTVISVSQGIDIPVGVEAVFSRHSGFTINIRNENYVVLAEEEIFFIIKKQ